MELSKHTCSMFIMVVLARGVVCRVVRCDTHRVIALLKPVMPTMIPELPVNTPGPGREKDLVGGGGGGGECVQGEG